MNTNTRAPINATVGAGLSQEQETMPFDRVDHEPPLAPANERADEAPPAEELAAPFFQKLKALAGFGLAAHTRLLLGTSRQDG